MAIEINQLNFDEMVLKSTLPVVLDLWAEWCGPCRMIALSIEELADEYAGRAIVGKVDVDSNPSISQRFSVLNIPTVLFLKNGEVVEKVVGAVPKKKLIEALEKVMKS